MLLALIAAVGVLFLTHTIFLIDAHVTAETAPLVRRMFAEGHAVALHSDARWLMLKSGDELAASLIASADRIEQLAGIPAVAGSRTGVRHAVRAGRPLIIRDRQACERSGRFRNTASRCPHSRASFSSPSLGDT